MDLIMLLHAPRFYQLFLTVLLIFESSLQLAVDLLLNLPWTGRGTLCPRIYAVVHSAPRLSSSTPPRAATAAHSTLFKIDIY